MSKKRRVYVAPKAEVFRSGRPMQLLATVSLDGNVGDFQPGDPGNISEDIWDDYIENNP